MKRTRETRIHGRPSIRPSLLAFLALLGWGIHTAPFALGDPPPDDLEKEHASLERGYAEELNAIAEECLAAGDAEAAKIIHDWPIARAPMTLSLVLIDAASDDLRDPTGPNGASEEKWWRLREAQAEALFDLARRAVHAKQPALALETLFEVVRENPDHANARRLLGYKRRENRWLTSFEFEKETAKVPQVWSTKFGWLPAEDLERYEQGERKLKGRWVSAEEDARVRTAPEKGLGWDVRTEHFRVHTDHSLEEGVRVALALERLHSVWKRLFFSFLANDGQISKWIEGPAATRIPGESSRTFEVRHFRRREDYLAAIAKVEGKNPINELSAGYYHPKNGKSFFFADTVDGRPDDTSLYHEATHQLFAESRRLSPKFGQHGNFWVVEGIACYMESLAIADGACHLGGRATDRWADAHSRLMTDGFYVPLSELVTLDLPKLKTDSRVIKLYSQFSGLTYFLMHAEEGRWRKSLGAYLGAIYAGADRADTLAKLTRVSTGDLDLAYKKFVTENEPSAP